MSESPQQANPSFDERVARMRDRAERDFPPAWKAENAGDEIAGELARYERGQSHYGPRIIAVLRGPNGGERAVWLHETVLLDEFNRQRPQVGEFVLIRYEGRKQSARGSEYAHFRVVVDRDAAGPDWDALGDPSSPGIDPTPTGEPAGPHDVGQAVHEPLEPEPGPETPHSDPNDPSAPPF